MLDPPTGCGAQVSHDGPPTIPAPPPLAAVLCTSALAHAQDSCRDREDVAAGFAVMDDQDAWNGVRRFINERLPRSEKSFAFRVVEWLDLTDVATVTFAEANRRQLLAVLETVNGNQAAAARILGVSPRTVRRMLGAK